MTIQFAIMGGVEITIPYTLYANTTYDGKIKPFAGLNDVPQQNHVVGDTFYVGISHSGLGGKTVRLTGYFNGDGDHQLFINNQQAVGSNGGYVDITIPPNGADIYVPIRSVQVGVSEVTNLSFSLTYNSAALSTFTIPAALFEMNAVWIDPNTDQELTVIEDNAPFKLSISHNSNQLLAFGVIVLENTVIGEITPDIPTTVYGTIGGIAESNIFVVNRVDRTLADRLTVKVISPREPTVTLSPSITIQTS